MSDQVSFLPKRSASLVPCSVKAGTRLWRVYHEKHPDPLGYSLGPSRFSGPPAQLHGVVYTATSLQTAFAEGVIRDTRDGAGSILPLEAKEVIEHKAAEIEVTEDLHLLDLRGTALLRMGIPTDVIRGRSHTKSQLLAAEVYSQHASLDGFNYSSRLDEGQALAVFDRAIRKLKVIEVRHLLYWQDQFTAVMSALDVRLELPD